MMETYVKVLRMIKVENPALYKKLDDAEAAGFTGNEIKCLVANELYKIKKGDVSEEIWKLIPQAMRELAT